LNHYWTPQLRSSFFGSYLDSDGRTVVDASSDFREYRLGANLIWQPVAGLDIGVEAIYANVDLRGPLNRESDGWEGRLRIQRDF